MQKIIYALFYSSSGVLTYCWFEFLEYMQDSAFYRIPLLKHISKIPVILVVTLSFLSIWTGSFFYIGENGEYCRGNLYTFQLFLTYGYLLFSEIKVLGHMILTKDVEKKNTFLITLSYIIFPIIFGVLQIFYQDLPLICIGITLSSLQYFLFNVKFEQEREISSSKIHSLSRLFIISYYVDLQTGNMWIPEISSFPTVPGKTIMRHKSILIMPYRSMPMVMYIKTTGILICPCVT